MRKTIPVRELRLGMAVVDIPGSWLDHGMWRTRFLVQDSAELAALWASSVATVVIDTDMGLDVAGPRTGSEPQDAVDQSAVSRPLASVSASRGEPRSIQRRLSPGAAWARAQSLVADTFKRVREGCAIDAVSVTDAVDDIVSTLERDRFTMMGLGLLKKCDTYTFAHSVSVCALMVAFGQHLKFDTEHCRALGTAGLFHDIGKAAVSEALILKPGALTDEEFKLVKQHPAVGADYLGQMRQSWPIAIDVCLHHHERIDGGGYMDGLQGHQISLESRMAAICDVYDAITSARPYKEAWDPAVALRKMVSWAGHFDRPLLASFVAMMSPFPMGSLVRLASGRVGVVIRPSPEAPRKATVQVFYNTRTHAHLLRKIDLTKGEDEIVAVESEDAWSTDVVKAIRQEAFSAA